MSCLDYCSCPQLSSLQGFLHTEAQEVFTEQNSVTSLKPDSLRRRRPCKRKSLPPSSVYTHCLTYSASHCTPDTPIYSLTELLSVPLICCFSVTQAPRVCLMPTTLFPPLLLHFSLANSCVFLLSYFKCHILQEALLHP